MTRRKFRLAVDKGIVEENNERLELKFVRTHLA